MFEDFGIVFCVIVLILVIVDLTVRDKLKINIKKFIKDDNIDISNLFEEILNYRKLERIKGSKYTREFYTKVIELYQLSLFDKKEYNVKLYENIESIKNINNILKIMCKNKQLNSDDCNVILAELISDPHKKILGDSLKVFLSMEKLNNDFL